MEKWQKKSIKRTVKWNTERNVSWIVLTAADNESDKLQFHSTKSALLLCKTWDSKMTSKTTYAVL